MTSLATPRLEDALRLAFAPSLRDAGFTGSGRTYRRLKNAYVQVVKVQGNRYGGSFAVNLGIQPVSVRDLGGEQPNPKKITEMLCEFRRRLAPSGVDYWWQYDLSASSMSAAAADSTEVLLSSGLPLFDLLCDEGGLLDTISASQLSSEDLPLRGFGSTLARMAFTFARLRRHQGLEEAAAEFASLAKRTAGSAATILHSEIRKFEAQQ